MVWLIWIVWHMAVPHLKVFAWQKRELGTERKGHVTTVAQKLLNRLGNVHIEDSHPKACQQGGETKRGRHMEDGIQECV
eukprot:1160427-Pelagomonas_calceolata.AAC.6